MNAARENPSVPTRARLFMRAAQYLAGKALTVAVTIFLAVFITVLLANQPSRRGLGPLVSPFEESLERQISLAVRQALSSGPYGVSNQAEVEALTEKFREEAGLNLPYLPRFLLWTVKALSFDWGALDLGFGKSGSARDVILQHLPDTLLLIGTAYLLIFLIGIPLSLYLARKPGSRADRLFAILAPLSSMPSWVFGVFLITIFAFQLRWLPFDGKYDIPAPSNSLEYMLDVAKHMIMPVSAIVLSLLFQVVYTWRTFFVIYSEEDYVDLARAKGLPAQTLERRYILRPALPYVITTFATSLIGFWQLSMAQEAIFQWPGLGLLYIREALPDFFGESMDPGQLIIVIGIVVIFAYLLGFLVLLLDLVYMLIDPRILLLPTDNAMQKSARDRSVRSNWFSQLLARLKRKSRKYLDPVPGPVKKWTISWDQAARDLRQSSLDFLNRNRLFFQELRRYPSAMFGLAVVIILFAGSIYAVVGLPYDQIGQDYGQKRMTGFSYAPRTAMPAWMNIFSETPWLSTLVLDESSEQVSVSTRELANGWTEKTTIFTFDYFYREMPSEIFLYLEPRYVEKIPFLSLTWTYPDGRTLDLKSMGVNTSESYDFQSSIRSAPLLIQNPAWKSWFVPSGLYPTPVYKLLFADPESSEPVPQHGTYQLTVTSLLFEKESSLESQLVLLGQVYGLAGTDYARRDLTVPLFWGMPFALLIGLGGTLITALVALLLPAIGVWFGGWVDNFIQRLTEVNMVLPSLSIAVLVHAIFNMNIWVVLAIVVGINALGSPIKILRSALLQAKQAPYIETARSYGASDFRIITRYLIPPILPVLIPLVVSQVPSFIFWEATLGLFNIRSVYPSWGRIIYDGLAHGALYGSPFWVLEPIFLLLLTSLAFAMLGSALERILNPRMIDMVPVEEDAASADGKRPGALQRIFDRRVVAVLAAALVVILVLVLVRTGKGLAAELTGSPSPGLVEATATLAIPTSTTTPTAASSPTEKPASVLEALPTPTEILATATPTNNPTATLPPTSTRPTIYALHAGEFPFCIARRFDLNPDELLRLNGLVNGQVFFSGMVLDIPQSGMPFPGNRTLQIHPTTYVVARGNETLYSIACLFGDVDPAAIAEANDIPLESRLSVGQQLSIP
ncbi:MAG: ABC transporter permease subunit [Chloroflexota bacterium]